MVKFNHHMKCPLLHNALLIIAVFILFTGCSAYRAEKVGPTDIIKASEEIPEDELLDLGIEVFESEEITEEKAKEEHTNSEVRKAETHFIPYHMKITMQQSSYWGAVRVLPAETDSIDALVKGKILESNGEHLVLQVDVTDATGNTWFTKSYESEAGAGFYSGNKEGEKDAFQDIYNAIANDLAEYRMKLTPQEVRNIRTVSKLKFAEDFAPSAYRGYLSNDENNIITINRLPAEEDPTITRVLKIRERENMYVDTLNAYYEEYYTEMWPSYEEWRNLNYEEVRSIKKIKRDALMRKLTGALLVVGAVAMAIEDVENTGIVQAGMIVVGSQVIINGFNVSKEAEIHSAAIEELSESFGSEMRPVVMEFEGQQYELTGSAEEQFKRWRKLLHKIYITETGFDPDVSPATVEDIKTEKPQ
jgi:hypothetical protein